MGPRTTGLLFLLAGAAIFVGTTQELLPAWLFWVGIVSYPIGALYFLKGANQARQQAERRAVNAVMPRTGANKLATAHAEQQARLAQTRREAAQRSDDPDRRPSAAVAATPQLQDDELVLYEVDDGRALEDDAGFRVSTDVSFPLEVQEQRALGDQLEKLQRLRDEDIISDEEFATAKAKLLA